jgi:uncharacterized protein involved in exopolysaccharide biosynthesis
MMRALWSRKWLLIVPAVVGAGTSALVAALWMPARYESKTTIQVVPARVGSDFVRPVVSTPFEQRLGAIRTVVFSRTRLERIVQEFNLYPDKRRHGIMAEVIEQFRDDIALEIPATDSRGTVFRLSFTGADQRTVMKVTEKLSALFVNENQADRELLTQGTQAFLESQIEDVRKQLIDHETKLAALTRRPNVAETTEFDVLRSTYRSLLEKRQDVTMAAALDARSIGESFKLIDPASYPERPIGPTRSHMNLMGAGAGLVMGLVLVAAAPRRSPVQRDPENRTAEPMNS